MDFDKIFWQGLKKLIRKNPVIVDRPKGKPHPRFSEVIYPLDYGYLENTSASDGGGIDVWLGSLDTRTLTGILCTFDKIKRNAEIKLLIGCTQEDTETIQNFHDPMITLFIPNPIIKK